MIDSITRMQMDHTLTELLLLVNRCAVVGPILQILSQCLSKQINGQSPVVSPLIIRVKIGETQPQPSSSRGGGRGGRAEEAACTRNGEVDPSAALTPGIHLRVLFLNRIHLATQRTSVEKGLTCVCVCVWKMDAIVRNAEVNKRRSNKKRRREVFLISKALPMCHHPCRLTSPPSVITFRERTTAGRRLTGRP